MPLFAPNFARAAAIIANLLYSRISFALRNSLLLALRRIEMFAKSKLLALVVLVILLVYVHYYYRYPVERLILQTTLQQFEFGILLQRQPVVIEDKVLDLSVLSEKWFPSNKKDVYAIAPSSWARTQHKYTVIHVKEDTEILVLHAGGKYGLSQDNAPDPEETLTSIVLQANQILILPFHTLFYTTCSRCEMLAVHDWVTRFLP